MNIINETNEVKEQYKTAEHLNTRISIHDKYSTNKLGLSNWYFTIYQIEPGMKILELGCGSGSLWKDHQEYIEKCEKVIISDFSEGMAETAEANIGKLPNVEYRVIDIQDIPYEAETFDIVIANYMLYHVPNIPKALSEVSRVLKKGGKFYAGTTGEVGVFETVVQYLGIDMVFENTFSLENGTAKLEPFFSKIETYHYEDALEITNLDDLMEYLYSGMKFEDACKLSKEEVRGILARHMENGILRLPKDPGTFVAIK